jgi:hypothetical protein
MTSCYSGCDFIFASQSDAFDFPAVHAHCAAGRPFCLHPSRKKSPSSFPQRIFGTSKHVLGRIAFSSSSIKHGDTEDDGAAWLFAEIVPSKMRTSPGLRKNGGE